jgi:glycosyltransferase involved in cell wall biosynthesis
LEWTDQTETAMVYHSIIIDNLDVVLLTIAIPTYNRNEKINLLLSKLLPQLIENVCVRIIDNASPIPVHDSIISIENKPVYIHRNSVNIGMAANINRCFEYCDTEWLWVLGDDDIPDADAVRTIFATIQKYPEVVFYSFGSNCCKPEDVQIIDCINAGQDGLIDNLKSFSNLLFLSSGVYNCFKVKGSIKAGYYFSNTFASHTAILLDYLGNNPAASTVFLSSSISTWVEPLKEEKWGENIINKSIFDLMFIIKTDTSRKVFYNKVNRYHPYYSLSEGEAIRLLILNPENKKEIEADFFSGLYFKYWSFGYKETSVLMHSIKTACKFMLLKNSFFSWLFMIKASREDVRKKTIFNKFQEFKKDGRL